MKTPILAIAGLAFCASGLVAAPPHIAYLYPAGGQRGERFELLVGGQDFAGVSEVRFSGPGVTAEILGVEDLPIDRQKAARRRDEGALWKQVRVAITLADDAPVGERDLRVVTPGGLSNRFRFFVGAIPEVVEEEANSHFEKAQKLSRLPIVANGQIYEADKDFFRFSARRGQDLLLELKARQIKPFLADAVPGWFQASITLYDANGRRVAYQDDFRFLPDPVITWKVPADGDYVAEVKDVIFRGRDDFVYRLSIGELPYLTDIYPMGGRRGETITVRLNGINLAADTTTVHIPDDASGPLEVAGRGHGLTSNTLPFAVNDLEEIFEQEPNNNKAEAQEIVGSSVINGYIEKPREADFYRFKGRKGKAMVIEVEARRLDSSLDSRLTLFDAKSMKTLASDDDTMDDSCGLVIHHADSRIHYTFKQDQECLLKIEDVQGRGGPACRYRLRLSAAQPDYALRVLPDNPAVPRGGVAVIKVKAFRRDGFTGPVDILAEDLPPGCSLAGAAIPAGRNEARFTISATSETTEGAFAPTFRGVAQINGQTVSRPATPAEELMQAFIYYHNVPTRDFTLSVAPPDPFTLEVVSVEPGAVLETPAGSEVTLRLRVTRNGKVDAPVRVILDQPDKGISARPVSIPKGETERDLTVRISGTEKAFLKGEYQTNLILTGTLSVKKTQFTAAAPAVPIRITPKGVQPPKEAIAKQ